MLHPEFLEEVAQLQKREGLRSQVTSKALDDFRGRKLLVVQTYLPVTVVVNGNFEVVDALEDADALDYAKFLASATDGVVSVGCVRVQSAVDGQPVQEPFSKELQGRISEFLNRRGGHEVRPLFNVQMTHRYADSVLFPLFHYSLPPAAISHSGSSLFAEFEAFSASFARQLLEVVAAPDRAEDVVALVDYRLFLVPRALRTKLPESVIAFYLHTVFPSSEIYRVLPERTQVLQGILGCNVIAVHNFRFARHLLTSCTRVLGLECSSRAVLPCEESAGSSTRVVPVAMGIDFSLSPPEASDASGGNSLPRPRGRKMLLSIDALDETKGITHKLLAFRKMLAASASASASAAGGGVVLVQICTAERASERTSSLARRIYQIVGEINAEFGAWDEVPVHFIIVSKGGLSRDERAELYRKADLYLDTSLRDVMSQGAFEFLACGKGVLVLSEFSGSAITLRAAALAVNPWNIGQFAETLKEALTMEPAEQQARLATGKQLVEQYTSKEWARRFVEEIQESFRDAQTERLEIRPKLDQEVAVTTMRLMPVSGRCIIVVALVGALSALTVKKKDGTFSEAAHQLVNTVNSLATSAAENLVVIYSSCRPQVLDSLFSSSPGVVLMAECGAYVKEAGAWSGRFAGGREEEAVNNMTADVDKIMQTFADSTPGSGVDRREFSISWFYPKTQRDYGAVQSKELSVHLWGGPLLTSPAEIFTGPGFVEVRHTALNAAAELDRLLRERGDSPFDFALCIGDFVAKDEEIFNVIAQHCREPATNCFNCTVGKKVTRASYRLQDSHDAIFFLAKMSWASVARRKNSLDAAVVFSSVQDDKTHSH